MSPQVPWWQKALQGGLGAASGAISGYEGVKSPGAQNPWSSLGQSAAKIGEAYRERLAAKKAQVSGPEAPGVPGLVPSPQIPPVGPESALGKILQTQPPPAPAGPLPPAPGTPSPGLGLPPQSPLMKSGEIVTHPTLTMLGDKGPEAVVPLSGNYRDRVQKTRPSMLK